MAQRSASTRTLSRSFSDAPVGDFPPFRLSGRYASGQPAYAHFGLGKAEKVDVEVILPHGKGKLTHRGVTANQVLKVKQ